MKRFSFIMIALMMGVMAWADAPKGYAIFGDVPAGFTDLTTFKSIDKWGNGSYNGFIHDYIEYTGAGHSTHVCDNNYLRISFTSEQTMTLTTKCRIHIRMRRKTSGTGDVQVSFVRSDWGTNRAGFQIEGSTITTDYKDFVLAYEDRFPNDTKYKSYGIVITNGDNVFPADAHVFRFSAAKDEVIEIAQIYIEQPQPTRYYFFAPGDLPEAPQGEYYVDLREGEGTTMKLNNLEKGAETAYTHYTMNGNWFSFDQSLKAATDMSSVNDEWYLVAKLRTNVNQTSLNIRLNNAGAACWNQSSNPWLKHDGNWEIYQVLLSTSLKELTYGQMDANQVVFQIHANGSTASDYLDIEYVYLTSEGETPCENCFQVTL